MKSPVRCIHKVKTATNIKEIYTDEDLEKMSDNCTELRDLVMMNFTAGAMNNNMTGAGAQNGSCSRENGVAPRSECGEYFDKKL